jgi:hypothetical protein
MQPTCPKCGGTALEIIQNELHGMFVFCKKQGCWTFPVDTGAGDFHEILRRYEHAFIAVEQDGDDSDAALEEQKMARAALLLAMRKARKAQEAVTEIGNMIGAPTTGYFPEQERKELVERLKKVADVVIVALAQ